MSGSREKLRSLSLAFLMVMSVFAMSTAFVGSAAGNQASGFTASAGNVEITQDSTTSQITLTGLDDDGNGDTLTIPTSNLAADVAVTDTSVSGGTSGITDSGVSVTNEDIEIDLPSSNNGDLTLDVTYDTSGQVSETSETLTVTTANSGQTADVDFNLVATQGDLQVTDLSAPGAVSQGSTFTATANVSNVGGAEATQTLSYSFDNGQVATEEVTIGAGETQEVSYTFSVSESQATGATDFSIASDDDTASSQIEVTNSDDDAFVTGDVRDSQGNQIQNVENVQIDIYNEDDGSTAPIKTITPNQNGEYTERVPILDATNGDTYRVEAQLSGFDSYARTSIVEGGATERFDIRLERIVTPDDITIEDVSPDSASVDVDKQIDVTVNVTTDDNPNANGVPLEDTPVDATIVNDNLPVDGVTSINGETTVNTNADGLATFTFDVTPDANYEDIEEVVTANVEFDATEGSSVTVQQGLEFVGQPPAGNGQISGTVSEIDEEYQLGTESTSQRAEGVNVHAVRKDRLNENSNTFTADSNTLYRVVTDNAEEEVLDVRADYLFTTSDGTSVYQNTSGNTGFEIGDTGGDVQISVLQPGDYKIQEIDTTDGSVALNNIAPFTAENDLTYDGIAQRYENVSAVPNTTTDSTGSFDLINLYTDVDNTGTQNYVVIAGEGPVDPDGTNTGFANARGYDEVTVSQNADSGAEQSNVALSVQKFEVDINYDYELDVSFRNESGDIVKKESIETSEETEMIVNATAISQETGEASSDAAMGQEIDLEFVDDSQNVITPGFGALDSKTVTVDQAHADGTAYASTTFVADDIQAGSANISASTTNDLGELFETGTDGVGSNDESNQGEIEVFKTVEITGEVVNEDDENVGGAEVELINTNTDEVLATTQSGSGGSYVFTDVRTGQTLAINATALDQDGNEVYNTRELNGGNQVDTSLGGEDVVVIGAVDGVFEDASFEVSGLNPQNYTAESDEVFTVSATVENMGELIAQKTVEIRLDGDTVDTKPVELDGSESTTVEFEVDASNLSAGDYTHSVWTEDSEATGTLTVEEAESGQGPTVVTDPAQDLDGDGSYEDVNGDGDFNVVDVNALFQNQESDTINNNVDKFDFNGDGEVDIVDVNQLFQNTQ